MADTERQIRQMAEFIRLEAKEKAAEIRAKTRADADAERQAAVQNAKIRVAEEYERKEKAIVMEQRVAASVAEQQQRSRLLSTRDEHIQNLGKEAAARIASVAASNADAYASLMSALIKQCIVRLEYEPKIAIHTRPQDVDVVKKLLPNIIADVAAVTKAAGNEIKVDLDVVSDESLASSAGGIIAYALHGRIKCSNTLEDRLNLALYDLTPTIRDLLFPSARAEFRPKPEIYYPHMPEVNEYFRKNKVASNQGFVELEPAKASTTDPFGL